MDLCIQLKALAHIAARRRTIFLALFDLDHLVPKLLFRGFNGLLGVARSTRRNAMAHEVDKFRHVQESSAQLTMYNLAFAAHLVSVGPITVELPRKILQANVDVLDVLHNGEAVLGFRAALHEPEAFREAVDVDLAIPCVEDVPDLHALLLVDTK